jgi:hypothetical protein
MKKIVYGIAAVIFAVLVLSSMANASLDVQITVGSAQINPLQSQTITATTNERGIGIVLVIQPAEGSPFTDSLGSHPALLVLWNLLPSDTKTDIIGKIGGKIVSYKIVAVPDQGGDSIVLTFPEDFTGILGDPSTVVTGKYMVIFAFLGASGCKVIGIDFDCGSWFVIPEVPWGTVATLATSLCALPVFALYKRRRPM